MKQNDMNNPSAVSEPDLPSILLGGALDTSDKSAGRSVAPSLWILCYSSVSRLEIGIAYCISDSDRGSMPLMFKIATWNVNSIKIRAETVANWLREVSPDVLCLQELKCQDDNFPKMIFEDLGYNLAVFGQKTYNGVAILSKWPIGDIRRGLPGISDDDQARYIEGVIEMSGGAIRVASIYLPNGNPAPGPKYDYKLEWMSALRDHARALLAFEEPLLLAGDYNVIPAEADVHDPGAWRDDALFLPESRRSFRSLLNLGLRDAIRLCDGEPGLYTFWDYQAGAWQKNNGIRIDHILLSPEAANRLQATGIDKRVRGQEKPSDHVPVWADLS